MNNHKHNGPQNHMHILFILSMKSNYVSLLLCIKSTSITCAVKAADKTCTDAV